jgi:dynein intermediate chain 1
VKAKAGKKGDGGGGGGAPSGTAPAAAAAIKEAVDPLHSEALPKATCTLDRMVNQNMFEEIAMDFKYWEDASDGFRPGEGTLLPLWRFGSEKSRRRQVTCICWNPQYLDMFAVGYGSYAFLKQASGLINLYSLKNPSHPEFTLNTESGVMCLHFHPGEAWCGCVIAFCVQAALRCVCVRVEVGGRGVCVWMHT